MGFPCYNNIVSGNNIRDNTVGITFGYSSYKHKIHHNNFIDNTAQVHVLTNGAPEITYWDNDYPPGGNYWSDYNGPDLDGDGIGDSPYIIN